MTHFLLIGAALFALNGLRTPAPDPGPDDDRRIVVSEGRVRQLAQGFAMTWRRQPTARELRTLLEAFIKEEVYYREAVRLGLDRGDTLVRRRMQQKMEFLTEPGGDTLKADEAVLQAHLAQNRELFHIPPKAAFRQIVVKDGPEAAESVLARLSRSLPGVDVRALGASTLLPHVIPLTELSEIARIFGPAFADTLPALPPNEWSGPVRSPYGLHLVRITAWEDADDPPLDRIRAQVERHWRQATREAHLNSEYERMRSGYEIVLPAGSELALNR